HTEKQSVFASKSAIELIARLEQKTLADGSVIELNRGAIAEVEYSPEARRVRLIHGEANFTVAKDPDRPFIVNVAGIDVRAVGTQFNVRLTDDAVDVIVSEGIVRLATSQILESASGVLEEPLLKVGHRAVVRLGDVPMIDRSILSPSDMDRELGWQPRMLDFDDAPMSEIVLEFNRRNQVQLKLGDS
ncbi:MAG: FecR family protein, partial [Verrucomicrobiia bacterium]